MEKTRDESEAGAGRLMLWDEVRKKIPLSRTTLWLMRQRGEFPAQIRLSLGRIAWRESALNLWIATRATERR